MFRPNASSQTFQLVSKRFRLSQPYSTAVVGQANDNFQSDDYQFIDYNKVLPTYFFQKSLQRLPVPKLAKTCERYLAGLKPIQQNTAAFKHTTDLVNAFQQSEGKYLQDELVKYDKENKHTSYISKPWFDIYLKARMPLPIHSNPGMAFAPDPKAEYNDQLTRATNMVVSIGRFKRSLDSQVLTPELFHMNPKNKDSQLFKWLCRLSTQSLSFYVAAAQKSFALDMSQYKSLFGTARIPQMGMDTLVNYADTTHFVVMRLGHMFSVQLFDEKGQLHSPASIHAALAHIMQLDLQLNTQSFGSFTAMNRDQWASVRQAVQPQNQAAFETVDSAQFVLCLDDFQSMDPIEAVQNVIHGFHAGANRWFDKSFSLIVDKNGLAAFNFEHSWGDGVAVLRLMEEVQKDCTQSHFVHPDTKPDASKAAAVEKIEFTLSEPFDLRLQSAKAEYQQFCDSVQFAPVDYQRMNRDTVKKHKLSPDALMQMAIQLAFYRMSNGKRVATYESCSTAVYKHGRTEVMRPATEHTNALTEALCAPAWDKQAIRALMHQCSHTHYQLCKEASMGQGFDRHLLGLKITADRLQLPMPEMFADPSYEFATNFVLSTSTLSTDTILLGGFGPVVPDGFGIGYNVVKHKLGSLVSAYKEHRDALQMADALTQALDDLKLILESTHPVQK